MNDRFNQYKNCEIMNVYQKMLGNIGYVNEYIVEVRVDNKESGIPGYISLKIDKLDFYKELVEMMEGKRQRVCATHGITYLDIYKSQNQKGEYCIEWSPNEASYNCFYFKEKNFVNCLVNALTPKEEKIWGMEMDLD